MYILQKASHEELDDLMPKVTHSMNSKSYLQMTIVIEWNMLVLFIYGTFYLYIIHKDNGIEKRHNKE